MQLHCSYVSVVSEQLLEETRTTQAQLLRDDTLNTNAGKSFSGSEVRASPPKKQTIGACATESFFTMAFLGGRTTSRSGRTVWFSSVQHEECGRDSERPRPRKNALDGF